MLTPGQYLKGLVSPAHCFPLRLQVLLKSHEGLPPSPNLCYSQIYPALEPLKLSCADATPGELVKMLTFSSLRFCIFNKLWERLIDTGPQITFQEDSTQCCSEIKCLVYCQPPEHRKHRPLYQVCVLVPSCATIPRLLWDMQQVLEATL